MPLASKHDAYFRGLYVIWAVVLVLVGAATYLLAKTPDLLAGWIDLIPSWLPFSGQETNAIACGDVEAAQLWRAVFAVLWPLALLGIVLSMLWLRAVGWRSSAARPEGVRLNYDLFLIVMVTGLVVLGTALWLFPDPLWSCDRVGKPDLFLTVMITATLSMSTMGFPAASRCFAWSIGRYRYVGSAPPPATTAVTKSPPLVRAVLWCAAFFAVSWGLSLLSLAVPVLGHALFPVFVSPILGLATMLRPTGSEGPACPVTEQDEINAVIILLPVLASALSVVLVLMRARTIARSLREVRRSALARSLNFSMRSQTVSAFLIPLIMWPMLALPFFGPHTPDASPAVCSAVEPATWESATGVHLIGIFYVFMILQPILWLLSYVVRSKAPS